MRNAPRLIVRFDNSINTFKRSDDDVIHGSGFHLNRDVLTLDESESLLAHFDE